MSRRVFITGATGYLGSRLAERLVGRGYSVRGLVRKGSEGKLPEGVTPVFGDALRRDTFSAEVAGAETFVQLVGVAHPSPAKAKEFREIDLVSARESIAAATQAGVAHFVYVSVAHPAPIMKAYIEVRMECERMLLASGMKSTILRPWYVLGPGHRWAELTKPFYWLAEQIPPMREGARRTGLVTIDQMVDALTDAVQIPSSGENPRVWEVPAIREKRERLGKL